MIMKHIPITMCHGVYDEGDYPLNKQHFDSLMRIARELGFESIDYNALAAWRKGESELPDRPIMFDFDHPRKSMRHEMHDVLDRYGYRGNLFVNTGPMTPGYTGDPGNCENAMTWNEIGELMDFGWHIGAHTVTHPDLSKLASQDPAGEKLQEELEQCDAQIEQHLGIKPQDFAFTGTSWSSMAETLVMQRYRFGRLWIIGSQYNADGNVVRYADLVGVGGDDELDGGPPMAARYITCQTHACRLPSVELQSPLLHQPEQFRAYLERSWALSENA